MSVETVYAFWKKINEDPALLAKLKALAGQDQRSAQAAMRQIAASAGFPFSEADYQTAVQQEAARGRPAGT
jgi:predicted ribosomally synthesized peptide with nif11-like leader